MRRRFLLLLLLAPTALCWHASARSRVATRRRLPRSPPLTCSAPSDDDSSTPLSQHAVSGAVAGGGGVGAWVQTNVLQGVSGGPLRDCVMTVYFVQGALGLAALARTYFMKDQLGLSPAEVAALSGITTLPWVIKPVYGFLTDGLPIMGYRRKPYLIIAGTIGCAAWLSLATLVETPAQAVFASTIASLGVAVSDVVVDSLVVERAREDPTASSGALQSLCWTCQSLGALTSAYFSGSLLERMSPQGVFGLTAFFPLLVVGMALQLDEAKVAPRVVAPPPQLSSPSLLPPPPAAPGALQEFGELVSSQGALLWEAVQQRQVWLPALFLVLWQATPSSGSAFFYFLTDECGIGPELMGRVNVGSSLASLFGIWAYRKYLQQVPVKKVLGWSAVASAVLGSTQLLLITHANRELGISDYWFTFGDDVVLSVIGQFAFMPLLVLAASLCPPGVEGTLFALLMSLFNGAGILGNELGALLTDTLGVKASAEAGGATDFTNLGLLVTICNLSSLLPLLALSWLDEAPGGGAGAEGGGEAHQAHADAPVEEAAVEGKVVGLAPSGSAAPPAAVPADAVAERE